MRTHGYNQKKTKEQFADAFTQVGNSDILVWDLKPPDGSTVKLTGKLTGHKGNVLVCMEIDNAVRQVRVWIDRCLIHSGT